MKVYVIQSDLGLGFELENRYATLNKEVAKQMIKHMIRDEIVDNLDYDEDFDEQEFEQTVEKFAQDLVDGNTENHSCDEFEGISVWCDILSLKE